MNRGAVKSEDIQSSRAGRAIKLPQSYWAFAPAPLPPDLTYAPSLIQLLTEAGHALGELAGLGRVVPNPHLLVTPAVRREAVLSSRIEGTRSDIEDLFLFEAAPEEPVDPDVREVHNYVVALEYGIERLATLPVSLRLVREIHGRLVRGDATAPGEFRNSQNWIGPAGCTLNEAVFVPPPVHEMHTALADWEKYLHAPATAPALVRLALMHVQFEMIHPFLDGNGRVGRLLIVMLMCHWDLLPQPLLYLSAFFERHRDDYYRHLLRVSHHGEWEAWIEFFLRAVREQARDAVASGKALLDLQARYRTQLSGRRISKITGQLLDQLFINPIVTAPLVRDRWQVNFRTARKAIDNLVDLGILREMTGRRRNRTWAAYEVLAIASGKIGEQL